MSKYDCVNPAFQYRYQCSPVVSIQMSPKQARLLLGLLEDTINDEDFKYAYNEDERETLKDLYERYKHCIGC